MPHVTEIDNLLRISKSERALQTLQQQQQAASNQMKSYTDGHSDAFNSNPQLDEQQILTYHDGTGGYQSTDQYNQAQTRRVRSTASASRRGNYLNRKQQKWRNMDIEQANESLLKKMVNIVNVSHMVTIVLIYHFLNRERTSTCSAPGPSSLRPLLLLPMACTGIKE